MVPLKALTAYFLLSICLTPYVSYAESEIEMPATGESSEIQSDLDMQDARSRFLIWVGEPNQGLRRLDEALARDPDNVELEIVKADIDFRLGKKLAAYDRISKLMRRASDNPSVKHLYSIIKASLSSNLSLGWSLDRPAPDALEHFSSLKLDYMLTVNHRVGLKLTQVDLNTPAVRNSANNGGGRFTDSQNKVGLSYLYMDISGDELGGEILTETHHWAVKGSYKKWRPWGYHLMSGMTNQLYWGTQEAIANEYRRGGLLYESDYYVGYDLQSHWGLGLYRYHSKYQGNIAKSIWYNLSLDYKIPERFTERYLKKYHINVHYSLKGELYSELSQINNGEGEYTPFFTPDREVHMLTADIPWERNQYRVVPFIGGANNTHGTHGVVFGINAVYRYGFNYEVSANLSHNFIGDNNYIGNSMMLTATARF